MDTFRVGLLLQTMIEALAVNAEIEGMKAENLYHQNLGAVPFYGEASFEEKAQKLWSLSKLARARAER